VRRLASDPRVTLGEGGWDAFQPNGRPSAYACARAPKPGRKRPVVSDGIRTHCHGERLRISRLRGVASCCGGARCVRALAACDLTVGTAQLGERAVPGPLERSGTRGAPKTVTEWFRDGEVDERLSESSGIVRTDE